MKATVISLENSDDSDTIALIPISRCVRQERISICLSLSICRISVCPSVRPSVPWLVGQFVRPSVRQSVRPSVRQSVRPSVTPVQKSRFLTFLGLDEKYDEPEPDFNDEEDEDAEIDVNDEDMISKSRSKIKRGEERNREKKP